MRRIDGHVVVGGMAHDFDSVRLDLLTLAAEDNRLRLRVSSSFEEVGDGAAAPDPTFLISYTCNVAPSDIAISRLQNFLAGGGRWVTLHATNALLDWRPEGVAGAPITHPFLSLMGSSFQAHPPLGQFTVEPVSAHPVVAGLGPFDVEDELYLADLDGAAEVLMATRFSGMAPGFIRSDWRDDDPVRPVVYLKQVGAGTILHCALGHRRGHYDAPHRTPYLPVCEDGPWKTPAFRMLLRRAIAWAARTDPALEMA